jgi:circadian clock protein KaiC
MTASRKPAANVTRKKTAAKQPLGLGKAPTGIQGLDELTVGGLPRGRPTLLCGDAGSGKTLLAMEFLVRGAVEFGEPGVFMAFEETTPDLASNFASLGYDLKALAAQKKLVIESVHIERSEIEETGQYDLEGLFIRLNLAIDSIGAKRVVLDTVEALFSALSNTAILRAELRRLFRWLKDKGVTAIITGERGDSSLSRHGLEEYVADCVILLDHRVEGQMATRRLRIVKYRGSMHGTSEYPFLIDEGGISILPITSIGLNYEAGAGRVSSGIPQLDAMMGGKGYYRGSSVLVSGTAGSGKTSVAALFANAAATRGERCLWFALEESASQIIRNMGSIGIDLEPAVRRGMLRIHAERSTICGLEMHLVTIHKLVREFKPRIIVIDPVTSYAPLGSAAEIKAMLMRLIDFLKTLQVTTVFTSLTGGGPAVESTPLGVASLMDTWLLLRDVQNGAERNRVMHLIKSRGMAHSNQVREFLLTDHGLELREVYVGPSGDLLTGSARVTLEAQEKARALVLEQKTGGMKRELESKRQAVEAKIAGLRAEFEVEQAEAENTINQDEMSAVMMAGERVQMERLRESNASAAGKTPKHKQGNSP